MSTSDNLSTLTPAQLRALDEACKGRHPTVIRQFRRDICHFVVWCAAERIDPFRPLRVELDRYRTTLSPDLGKSAIWKLNCALRALTTAAEVLADEHGLGTGNASAFGDFADDAGLAFVVTTLVESRQSPRDRSVYRSGLNKLARWASDFDVDLMAIDAADLEDFRAWLPGTERSKGEKLVIARRFLQLTRGPETRSAVDRLRSLARSASMAAAPAWDNSDAAQAHRRSDRRSAPRDKRETEPVLLWSHRSRVRDNVTSRAR